MIDGLGDTSTSNGFAGFTDPDTHFDRAGQASKTVKSGSRSVGTMLFKISTVRDRGCYCGAKE